MTYEASKQTDFTVDHDCAWCMGLAKACSNKSLKECIVCFLIKQIKIL